MPCLQVTTGSRSRWWRPADPEQTSPSSGATRPALPSLVVAPALSVLLHIVSPTSKGLFHRAISMSGSPISKSPLSSDLYHLAVKQAQLLDGPTNNSKIIIDCLKTKPWRELGTSVLGFYEFALDPVRICYPVVEKDFGQERLLDMQTTDDTRENKFHAVPYIASQTEGEFFWMAFILMFNLTVRHSPQPVWYYEFSFVFNHSHYEEPLTKKPIAAAHHDDLIYLFSLSYRTEGADSATAASTPPHRHVVQLCQIRIN
ncbi:unnamed protein product [Danaus chrysippus]|uniref:(African queen) hypothetical protein n=1 Tax=Danaus chrysippus TaxID=151541 RepID=A0A8J2VT50_9NEOP|nr:unnamed protein product [Danaus chrysippus]